MNDGASHRDSDVGIDRNLPPAGNTPDGEPHPLPPGTEQVRQLFERLRKRARPGDGARLFGGATFETPAVHSDETDGPAGSHSPQPADALQQIGRFTILRKLGEGGYGVVFLASDPQLNRHVALKVPGPGVLVQSELLRRFLREGEAAAALDHPHIVPVHEAGQVGAVNYIASTFVEGESLSEWLSRRHTPVEPQAAARLVAVLAEAVQHAHSRGVLHRDLKPANVLLEQSASNETEPLTASELAAAVRLTDFGLAKLLQADPRDGDTQTQAILGTPAYMSPEQAEGRNRDVGTAADVYALGTILYELLTGEPPFKRASHVATLKAVCSEEPVPPSRQIPAVPVDLEAICLKCLEKPPEHRYATAAALAEDLRRFLTGDTVTARPIGRAERFRRWMKRNPGIAFFSGAATMLLLALAVGATVAAVMLDAAHRRTQKHLAAETAAKKEQKKQTRLALQAQYESYVKQAQLARQSARPGQRLESLRILTMAAKLGHRLKLSEGERRKLRNEVIACLSLPDVTLEKQWPGGTHAYLPTFDTDRDAVWYADTKNGIDTGKGVQVFVRRFDENSLVCAIKPTLPNVRIMRVSLGPNRRILVMHIRELLGTDHIEVWNLENRSMVRTAEISRKPFYGTVFDISADGQQLAVFKEPGSVEVWQAPSFRTVKSLAVGSDVVALQLDPVSKRLAVGRRSRIDIFDVASSKILRTLSASRSADIQWSPDGRWLATGKGSDGRIQIWVADTGRLFRTLIQRSGAIHLDWHSAGRYLLAEGNDQQTRLWDVAGNRMALLLNCRFPRFSRNGRFIAGRFLRYKLTIGEEHRIQPALSGRSIHSESRLMLGFWSMRRTIFQDLLTGKQVAKVRIDSGICAFCPTGKNIYVAERRGIYRLPVIRTDSATETRYRIGPPQRVCDGADASLAINRDGTRVAYAAVSGRRHAAIVNVQRRTQRILTPYHPVASSICISADGRLIAIGTGNWSDVSVWDTKTGERIRTIPSGPANVAMSPNGRLLAIHEGGSFSLRNPWNGETHFSARSKTDDRPGGIAFSADGRAFAVSHSGNQIQLRDTKSFAELAHFDVPQSVIVGPINLTPDGTRLVARWQQSAPGAMLHVWNLRLIRRRLKRMGLDWDHPPLPEDRTPATKPLRVIVDLGELAVKRDNEATRKWKREVNKLSAAQNADPTNPEFYYRRGRAYLRRGINSIALAEFGRALQLAPNLHGALFWRGRVLMLDRRYAKAAIDFEAALKLKPEDAWCCRHLAWIYATGPQELRNPQRAVELAETAVKLATKGLKQHLPTFHETLAASYFRNRNFEQALKTLNNHNAAPLSGYSLFVKAMCHHALGDSVMSRRSYKNAVRWVDKSPQRRTQDYDAMRIEAATLLGIEAD